MQDLDIFVDEGAVIFFLAKIWGNIKIEGMRRLYYCTWWKLSAGKGVYQVNFYCLNLILPWRRDADLLIALATSAILSVKF